ncbi:hypothetical protein CEP52_012084 [Fusarium oligoseptatum]|uniref:Major facilitator superfamily (MFS) profile domain-containing protein n=1 Tax=Fusarium oligoseptatum TaxID=2604345 RepID=A0A428T028_9HYPO|nr:hypothetical protein CEP52_012084 [Fusarium oligoseptatum]
MPRTTVDQAFKVTQPYGTGAAEEYRDQYPLPRPPEPSSARAFYARSSRADPQSGRIGFPLQSSRIEDAKKAVEKLTSRKADPDFDVDSTVSMMEYTHQYELKTTGKATYLECFRGVDLRRTEITCMVWAIQNLSGSGFMGYSTYFFQQAGLDSKQSFNIAMGQYSLGAVGTILSWLLIKQFGRRTLYLSGLGMQFLLLLITGFLGLAPSGNSGASWAVAAMMVLYTGVYDMTVGPVCYALVPEIPCSRLRTRTVVIGRNLYNVINIIMNIIIPYMLNPTAWNWKAKAGFFYAGLNFAELDMLFAQRVSARKFRDTHVVFVRFWVGHWGGRG